MRDSLGGLVNIIIIVVFIVLILGYLAFNVNYTKAFRMRDKTIDTYNRYNGVCTTGNGCVDELREYARGIGYTADRTLSCKTKYFRHESGLFCYKENVVQDGNEYQNKMVYYTIYTNVVIDVPILRNIIRLINGRSRNENVDVSDDNYSNAIFEIRGNTKTFVDEV